MLIAPATANTKSVVDALLADQTPEGRSLDYKRDLKLATDDDKREFARDVSSFANAAGGFLVFGVQEAKAADGKAGLGYPADLPGIVCGNVDAEKLRIDSIIRDHLDPKVQGVTIHAVDGYERGPVLIVHIPKSWNGPHMLSSRQSHFFTRGPSGKRALDVHEIRSDFLAGSDAAKRIQNFRDERIGKIVADEAPVRVDPGAKLIAHVVPIADDAQLDVSRLAGKLTPMGFTAGGSNHRHNLDGFVAFDGSERPSYGYSMAFRNGAIEGVSHVGVYTPIPPKPPSINGRRVETDALVAIRDFARLLRHEAFVGPLSVLISLVGTLGKRVVVNDDDDWRARNKYTIDRDVVLLPDVVLDGIDEDLTQVMKPALDRLWQASGHARSLGYDEQGVWDTHGHPGW